MANQNDAHGKAAMAVLASLMRTLKLKCNLSDQDLMQVFDSAVDERRGEDQFSEPMRQAIRNLQDSVLPSSSHQKH